MSLGAIWSSRRTRNIEQRLDDILLVYNKIAYGQYELLTKMEKIMATLDDVLNDVTAEGTQIDSVLALLDGMKKQLADALAGVALPADVQAKVDAVFADVETNKAKLQAAIDANTPAAPAPTPPPAAPANDPNAPTPPAAA